MKEKIAELIKEVTFTSVDENDKLIEGGILDSITIVELSVALENEFNLKIPFNEITKETFSTISTISHYLESKVSKK